MIMSKNPFFVPSLFGFGSYSILESFVLSLQWKFRHKGLLHASITFSDNHSSSQFSSLTFALFYICERLVFPLVSPYVKITVGYRMIMERGSPHVITSILGASIPLFDEEGRRLPKNLIYIAIERQVRNYGERYESALIREVFVNAYYDGEEEPFPPNYYFPRKNIEEERAYFDRVKEVVVSIDKKAMEEDLPPAKKRISRPIKNRITALKKARKEELRSFVVADLETVLVEEKHYPYAAGFLIVRPGEEITSNSVESTQTFFIDKRHRLYSPQIEERSQKVLENFLGTLEDFVKKEKRVRTIFFHNLARFDGVFIIKFYAKRGKYKVKPLLRNNRIYEIKILNQNNTLLLRFRDSLALLPSNLADLSRTLCPELGAKGEINHETLEVSKLNDLREELLQYLRQDIVLLAGVMCKAQAIYYDKFQIDIEDALTISSLSMKIFRANFFNDVKFKIVIPTQNVDQFVRRGFMGGRVDVFSPFGEDLYLFDVNGLYAHIMRNCAFPCGESRWMSNLEGVDIDKLYGFFECFVTCPPSLNKPFLGYKKDKNKTLKFPSGRYLGVFFSEELKFAKKLGYKILLLNGYGFMPKDGIFTEFISELFACRLEAIKAGKKPIAWCFKTLMNALFGRLGINPESKVTELCNTERYYELFRKASFQDADWIDFDSCLVQLKKNIFSEAESGGAKTNMAVQIAAAITAHARIYMYPFLAREDCLYSDTDSIVLSNPLPPELVSDYELGLFKLEFRIRKGYFLAPKCYMLETDEGEEIIRHKGLGKSDVTADWFRKAYENPSLEEEKSHKASFRIDWKLLNIYSQEFNYKLALPPFTKRKRVYDENGKWIGTKPIKIIDLGSQKMNAIFQFAEAAEESGSQSEDEDLIENLTQRGHWAGRTGRMIIRGSGRKGRGPDQ